MRIFAIGIVCAGLAACDTPNFRTAQFQFGSASTLAATGNLRFVTERDRQLPHGRSKVVCSEPSPDYAVASGTDANAAAKAASPSPITELTGSVTTTEAVTPLTGREKGVLALRDGLFAACQAYVNGLIGKDAYSIVLSQYGMLLVGLLGSPATVAVTAADPKKPGVVNVLPPDSGSSFAVMLVSCINLYDPTRRDYDPAETGVPYLYNEVLDRKTCRDVIRRAASGRAG
jgi:hypothetical protein